MQSAPQTPERISLRCPKCDARLKATRALLGKHCPCPRCRTRLEVRIPLPSDADIALVMTPPQPAR